MRPEILFPLFSPARSLPGIGPRLEKLVEKLAGPRVIDLLWHLPSGLIDRRSRPKIAEVRDGEIATIEVTIGLHVPPRTTRLPYRVHVFDETGEMQIVFFSPRADYIAKSMPEGEKRIISGRVDFYQGSPQMTHPDHILPLRELNNLPLLEAVYPLTAGLTLKPVQKAMQGALRIVPDLPEWQNAPWLKAQGWEAWRPSLLKAHAPQSPNDVDPAAPARARLAYDELLANQLALGLVRLRMKKLPGRSIIGSGQLRSKVVDALPFALTDAQLRSLAEIDADMKSSHRMLRLLQGDVGSGKTVVALLAMLTAVEAGFQAALMAPTEILARQHFATLKPLCEAAGVDIELLTGREKGKRREEILSAAATGKVKILVGTHALFQSDVAFKALAVAVVDEQHRFGVHQRLMLTSKGGPGTDVLVMTATPIPRTLTLTAYGDMDVSKLDEKPPGRKPVDTRALPLDRLEEVVSSLHRALERGAQIYWVCPLVEESDEVDAAAAEQRYEHLRSIFGAKVGLVHGRMKATDKDAIMARFESGEIRILVATTVIEVGVNVPSATVMIIEHAERFGLAQLHQLRGRVGRGGEKSSCLLLYHAPLGETAAARIKIMRETEDGFRIAEEDLRLRGAGELLGTRQSGLPVFRLADLEEHRELLAAAHDDARMIIDRDPELESDRGKALRILLYMFERDEAIRYLRSG
ncbi:MAG: ATP-dependent DNA helicase RecG [Parvibaculum sp.]|jgi:ATP-dependent DNA helicase RecG|uniref:ATP-dependent DNA helicase RecG n=1 Tax=Parvibaculum sp. TaxID=2024848 RepID=UPI000C671DBD|nr:ATP-dependent DNA helicase RecG [Parvibaculum sp.]MAU60333.1 ATP-dependent DNA helicase RecG [Parvibaculum sp.]HAC56901.1 ATP-dependent DNA helicase RecG [Rhodobiaceae bacterium]|tara:strand:+ start:1360 stop:3444 length:2085 start_codon:yes stop_codon:yes gene_type:complete